jgi:hypothetical protein
MKAGKISVFALAGSIFAAAVVLFFVYTIHAPMNVGEGGEAVGWVLAGVMLCLMVIFVLRTIFLSKKTAAATKVKLAAPYRMVNQFHMPLGCLAIALMYLHFTMVFNVADPSWIHFITGYILAGLMAALAVFGFVAHFNKTPARKTLTLCHQIDVVLLIVTFIVHLILK